MFPEKNFSPQQVALITCYSDRYYWQALHLCLQRMLGCLHCYIFCWLIIVLLISLFIILCSVYLPKNKTIYKLFIKQKPVRREEFYYKNILPQKTIEEVSEDVEAMGGSA